jgi:hypothetical protein
VAATRRGAARRNPGLLRVDPAPAFTELQKNETGGAFRQ